MYACSTARVHRVLTNIATGSESLNFSISIRIIFTFVVIFMVVKTLASALGHFPRTSVITALRNGDVPLSGTATWRHLCRWAVEGGSASLAVARALVVCSHLLRFTASLSGEGMMQHKWGELHDELLDAGCCLFEEAEGEIWGDSSRTWVVCMSGCTRCETSTPHHLLLFIIIILYEV